MPPCRKIRPFRFSARGAGTFASRAGGQGNQVSEMRVLSYFPDKMCVGVKSISRYCTVPRTVHCIAGLIDRRCLGILYSTVLLFAEKPTTARYGTGTYSFKHNKSADDGRAEARAGFKNIPACSLGHLFMLNGILDGDGWSMIMMIKMMRMSPNATTLSTTH